MTSLTESAVPYTANLPTALHSAANVRELDRLTIASGVPGFVLMTRAAEAAFALLQARWPMARRCVVLCGSGNNGGDGYVVARLARQAGWQVSVLAVTAPERLQGDAHKAWVSARESGVEVRPFSVGPLEADVIVDAVLGTGLQGDVRGDARAAIEAINAAQLPVLAIDIPSGLCADTGNTLGIAVNATVTVTFIGLKIGLVQSMARCCTGELFFAGLNVPENIHNQVPPLAHHVVPANVQAGLTLRPRDAHKGHFGHVLVIGGDLGMGGATLMAAEAAARVGAGLTSVATRREHIPALLARRPEVMVHPVDDPQNDLGSLGALIDAASVIVIGPGLGRNAWGSELFDLVLVKHAHKLSEKALVIDADGLFWLGQYVAEKRVSTNAARWVLTPHPGEAARLLQVATTQVQGDRIKSANDLQAKFQGVVVLKGAGSLVCDQQQRLYLATVGNPGMATGGMGDVLSGIIGGLLAQGHSLPAAACSGVWLHGAAADQAAEQGERGLLATDLFLPLRRLVNPMQK